MNLDLLIIPVSFISSPKNLNKDSTDIRSSIARRKTLRVDSYGGDQSVSSWFLVNSFRSVCVYVCECVFLLHTTQPNTSFCKYYDYHYLCCTRGIFSILKIISILWSPNVFSYCCANSGVSHQIHSEMLLKTQKMTKIRTML